MACATIPLACTTVLGLVAIHLIDGGRNDVLTARAMMSLLWPLAIVTLLDASDHANAAIVPATLWMGVMWWIDSYSLLRAPADATTTGRRKVGVAFETHTVTAMSYGLCGLVGARSDTRYTHLILYALMLCVMFVLPAHNLPSDDPFARTVDEVQRMCLVYAIAFLISGVTLTRATRAPNTS